MEMSSAIRTIQLRCHACKYLIDSELYLCKAAWRDKCVPKWDACRTMMEHPCKFIEFDTWALRQE